MANDVISANYAELKQKAAQLRMLAGKVSARPCKVALSSCKGDFADEIVRIVSSLNAVNNALATLALVTADRVDSMCTQFQEADSLASTQFSGGN